MLESFARALRSDDLTTVQFSVDRMARRLLEEQAPGEVRLAFSDLLDATADKSPDSGVALYLQGVARQCRECLGQASV